MTKLCALLIEGDRVANRRERRLEHLIDEPRGEHLALNPVEDRRVEFADRERHLVFADVRSFATPGQQTGR